MVLHLLKQELIGRDVNAVCKDGKEFAGKIIDESKSTIVLSTGKGEKKLAKRNHWFEFKVDGARVRIDGALIEKRPEERIKMKKNGKKM